MVLKSIYRKRKVGIALAKTQSIQKKVLQKQKYNRFLSKLIQNDIWIVQLSDDYSRNYPRALSPQVNFCRRKVKSFETLTRKNICVHLSNHTFTQLKLEGIHSNRAHPTYDQILQRSMHNLYFMCTEKIFQSKLVYTRMMIKTHARVNHVSEEIERDTS